MMRETGVTETSRQSGAIFLKSCLCLSFFKLNNELILFLAALGLRCCMQALVAASGVALFVVVGGLLIAVASLVAEHGL